MNNCSISRLFHNKMLSHKHSQNVITWIFSSAGKSNLKFYFTICCIKFRHSFPWMKLAQVCFFQMCLIFYVLDLPRYNNAKLCLVILTCVAEVRYPFCMHKYTVFTCLIIPILPKMFIFTISIYAGCSKIWLIDLVEILKISSKKYKHSI